VNSPHFVAGKAVPTFPLVAVVTEEPSLTVNFFTDFPQRSVERLGIIFFEFMPFHFLSPSNPLLEAGYREDVHDVITKLKVCNNVVQFEAKVLKAKTKKSLLRTVRITPELDEILHKDAQTKRMSVNALLTTILTKYAEWDRYTERFGYLTISKDLFTSVLGAADDAKLTQAALELGQRLPKEVILFFFKELNVDTFLAYMTLTCKYGHIAENEVETQGRNYTVTIHHDLGEKWSNYLQHFVGQTMKNQLRIAPKFEVIQNSLVTKFVAP